MRLSLPEEFVDISRFRVVPDAQEVFADVDTDRTLIVEILEFQKDLTHRKNPATYFFEDIAEQNNSPDSATMFERGRTLDPGDMPLTGAKIRKHLAVGLQRVVKFRESADAANLVRVFVADVRLPRVNADIIISFTVPVSLNPRSSSSKTVDPSSVARERRGSEEALFLRILRTFEILKWDIFDV
eukprot:g3218.t1